MAYGKGRSSLRFVSITNVMKGDSALEQGPERRLNLDPLLLPYALVAKSSCPPVVLRLRWL